MDSGWASKIGDPLAYKGGAAFKDCNHLPHTVGMVTDLDGHLTTRALESLGAELRRLRTKVENDAANPHHVVTVRGLGYKLQA